MKLKKRIAWLVSGVMMIAFAGIMPEQQSAPERITAQAAASDFTQAQAVQWMQDRVNEGWCVDVDGAAGCQCVDLLQAYGTYLGVYVPSLNAFQYASWGLPDGWTRVYSDPQPGDMFVQNPGVGGADATYGHVGLIMAVNGGTVTTAETNYWTAHYGNPNCRSVTRDASTFSSFIRPNFKSAVTTGHVMSEEEGAGQTLPDGDYYIFNSLSETSYVDIPGDEIISKIGTNIGIWNCEKGLPGQYDVWTVTYRGNGFYKIKQKDGELVLDAEGGTTNAKLNIELWEDIGSNAQQWSISTTDAGYKLQARCNACCLDVFDNQTDNGTNITTYPSNDGRNQRFCFIPYDPDERPLEDGVYRINSMDNKDFVLDVAGVVADEPYAYEANVQVWDSTGDDYFQIKYDKNGYYHIYEAVTGLALDIYSYQKNYTARNNNIQLYAANAEKRNQLWKIRDAGNGAYYLISQMNGLVLDAEKLGGKALENGRNVSTYTLTTSGSKNQMWLFTPYEEPIEETTTTTEETTTTTAETTTTIEETTTTTIIEESTEPTTEEIIPGTRPTEETTAPEHLYGDANDDGAVDIVDVIALNKFLLGAGTLPNTGRRNADTNEDTYLDTTDSLNILKLVVEILTPADFPIQ